MKITNILLSILILLLAAASAVFSYFLFEKRSQFVDGWGQMAAAINSAAVELDKDSGLKPLAEELTVQTLSHEQYSTLKEKLPKLAERSRQIVGVRDSLADAVRRVGNIVKAPNLADSKTMRGVDSHEVAQGRVISAVQSTVSNRDRIFNQMDQISRRQFNKPIVRAKMLAGAPDALKDFDSGITAINSRKGTYENTLRNIGRMVEVNRFDNSDKGFRNSAGAVVSGVKKLQDRCRLTQRNLDQANRTIKSKDGVIAQKMREIAMHKNTIAEKDRQINSYKRALGRPADDSAVVPWKDGSKEARSRLVGKVIEVHAKYGYVAVDIGKGSTVTQEIGNRKLEVNAGIVKGLEFTVARGSLSGKSEFIGKVTIDEVGEFCSTANIIPGAQTIKVGDVIYWTAAK